jgi:hypothetical protein
MMRDGYRLLCSGLPSRKNSGENITLSQPSSSLITTVKPTGIVDLITMIAHELIAITSLIIDSTEYVLKKLSLSQSVAVAIMTRLVHL